MSDEIRQEFEAEILAGIPSINLTRSKEHFDIYEDTFTCGAWWAWKKFRELYVSKKVLQKSKRKLKTHCYMGHEYTVNNTRVDSKGYRHCRTCSRETGADRLKRFRERQCSTPA